MPLLDWLNETAQRDYPLRAPDALAVGSPFTLSPAPIPSSSSTGAGLDAIAGIPLHVDVSQATTLANPVDTICQWDFGDSGAAYNTLEGFNAAHVYSAAGTYTLHLTVTLPSGISTLYTFSVTVAAASRTAHYFANAGNDSHDGLSSSTPKQSIAAANTLLAGGNVDILLNRGDTFDVLNGIPFNLGATNIRVLAYGTGSQPTVRMGDSSSAILFQCSSSTNGAVVQDLNFDTIFSTNLDESGGARAVNPMGSNVALIGCTLTGVDAGVQADFATAGVLIQDNVNTTATGLRGYGAFAIGDHWVILGNTLANSTRQHCVRVDGVNYLLAAFNNFTNLDRTAVDPNDIAKATFNLQFGNYFYCTDNDCTDGNVGCGPLPGLDGVSGAANRLNYVVIQRNFLHHCSLQINTGSSHVRCRNNVVYQDGAPAIDIFGTDPSSSAFSTRNLADVAVLFNTHIGTSSQSLFLRLDEPCAADQITLANNLMVSPGMTVQDNGFCCCLVNSDRSCFAQITNNLWPSPASYGTFYPNGSLFYVGSPNGVLDDAKTLSQWNAMSPAGSDQSANVSLPAGTYQTIYAGVPRGAQIHLAELLSPAISSSSASATSTSSSSSGMVFAGLKRKWLLDAGLTFGANSDLGPGDDAYLISLVSDGTNATFSFRGQSVYFVFIVPVNSPPGFMSTADGRWMSEVAAADSSLGFGFIQTGDLSDLSTPVNLSGDAPLERATVQMLAGHRVSALVVYNQQASVPAVCQPVTQQHGLVLEGRYTGDVFFSGGFYSTVDILPGGNTLNFGATTDPDGGEVLPCDVTSTIVFPPQVDPSTFPTCQNIIYQIDGVSPDPTTGDLRLEGAVGVAIFPDTAASSTLHLQINRSVLFHDWPQPLCSSSSSDSGGGGGSSGTGGSSASGDSSSSSATGGGGGGGSSELPTSSQFSMSSTSTSPSSSLSSPSPSSSSVSSSSSSSPSSLGSVANLCEVYDDFTYANGTVPTAPQYSLIPGTVWRYRGSASVRANQLVAYAPSGPNPAAIVGTTVGDKNATVSTVIHPDRLSAVQSQYSIILRSTSFFATYIAVRLRPAPDNTDGWLGEISLNNGAIITPARLPVQFRYNHDLPATTTFAASADGSTYKVWLNGVLVFAINDTELFPGQFYQGIGAEGAMAAFGTAYDSICISPAQDVIIPDVTPAPPADPPQTAAALTVLTSDDSTWGQWKGKYGGQGWWIPGDSQAVPAWAAGVTVSDSYTGEYIPEAYTADPTLDAVAPQKLMGGNIGGRWNGNGTSPIQFTATSGGFLRELWIYCYGDISSISQHLAFSVTGGPSATADATVGDSSGDPTTRSQWVGVRFCGELTVQLIPDGGTSVQMGGIFFGPPIGLTSNYASECYIYDNFSRSGSDLGNPTSGPAWVIPTGNWTLTSGQVAPTSSGTASQAVLQTGQSDVMLTVTASSDAGRAGNFGLLLRYVDANNYLKLNFPYSSGWTAVLSSVIAGSEVVIDTLTVGFDLLPAYTYQVNAVGDSLELSINQTPIGSFSTSQFDTASSFGLFTDGAAATFYGVCIATANSSSSGSSISSVSSSSSSVAAPDSICAFVPQCIGADATLFAARTVVFYLSGGTYTAQSPDATFTLTYSSGAWILDAGVSLFADSCGGTPSHSTPLQWSMPAASSTVPPLGQFDLVAGSSSRAGGCADGGGNYPWDPAVLLSCPSSSSSSPSSSSSSSSPSPSSSSSRSPSSSSSSSPSSSSTSPGPISNVIFDSFQRPDNPNGLGITSTGNVWTSTGDGYAQVLNRHGNVELTGVGLVDSGYTDQHVELTQNPLSVATAVLRARRDAATHVGVTLRVTGTNVCRIVWDQVGWSLYAFGDESGYTQAYNPSTPRSGNLTPPNPVTAYYYGNLSGVTNLAVFAVQRHYFIYINGTLIASFDDRWGVNLGYTCTGIAYDAEFDHTPAISSVRTSVSTFYTEAPATVQTLPVLSREVSGSFVMPSNVYPCFLLRNDILGETATGSWQGSYGAEGQWIPGDSCYIPTWVIVDDGTGLVQRVGDATNDMLARETVFACPGDTHDLNRAWQGGTIASAWITPVNHTLRVRFTLNDTATPAVRYVTIGFHNVTASNVTQAVHLVTDTGYDVAIIPGDYVTYLTTDTGWVYYTFVLTAGMAPNASTVILTVVPQTGSGAFLSAIFFGNPVGYPYN